LPIEYENFVTPPNALRLHWQSQADGGWEAEVRVLNFRYRFPELSGRNLGTARRREAIFFTGTGRRSGRGRFNIR